jgi:energy-converting hydrogenase Eha subunit C
MYWQHVFLLIITSFLIFILIYNLLNSNWGYRAHFKEALDLISINVSIIGGIGYVFLAWGMLNTLYLFTLSQPSMPLKAIIIALFTNGFIGFLCSRFISYEYSVFGLLVGAIVFMAITLKATLNFLNKLDYFYYAAY